MSELSTLLANQQGLLERLKGLDGVGEGRKKDEIAAVKEKLQVMNGEANRLYNDSRNIILDAIKKQRWFFIKNKPKVFFDRDTGYLWANLKHFPCCKKGGGGDYAKREAERVVQAFDGDGYADWKLPLFDTLRAIISDPSFPFREGGGDRILNRRYWLYRTGDTIRGVDLDKNFYPFNTDKGSVIPYSPILVAGSTYKDDVAVDNKAYTEKERLQFTLDLFVRHGLQPIFTDDSITELYHQVYFETPNLMADLQDRIGQISALIPLSETFDYHDMLGDYDVSAIDTSLIQYYTAIQRWIGTLLEKLDEYEGLKDDIIREFNVISLTLSRKYEADPHLTADENALLERRQHFFCQRFSLDMNQVKEKLISVKEQADALEERLDDLDADEQSLTAWAALDAEPRPSFSFIAENTAKIIKKALLKIEYFETHKELVQEAIALWQSWSDDYRVFKSTRRQELQHLCEEDDIEAEVWSAWYKDWQSLRRKIEEGMEPLVAWSLKELVLDEKNEFVQGKLMDQLAAYKQQIDDFFLKERKGIYQKYAFQPGGDLQDKFAAENDLYKRTLAFQEAVSKILFSCPKSEDRITILKWAYPLWNLQIDAVLQFVSDCSLDQISEKVLHEFADLKKRNYAAFLNDVAAYSKAQKEREKQYDSLMFKMRKELASNVYQK